MAPWPIGHQALRGPCQAFRGPYQALRAEAPFRTDSPIMVSDLSPIWLSEGHIRVLDGPIRLSEDPIRLSDGLITLSDAR